MEKTHASFFTGIRGFDEAAEAAGWENILHCEINERLRLFSEKLNPKAASYGDITKSDFTIHRGRVFCLSGGFPCQPYSVAGQRKGTEDERHLWPHMLRGVREIQPPWVVGENVRGIINWNAGLVFHQVQADLEAEGYEVLPFLLPAAGINAPHERYRTWFVAFNAKHYAAYANSVRHDWSVSEYEKYTSKGGVNAQCDIGSILNDGSPANTCCAGCEEQHISRQSIQKGFCDWGRDERGEYWQNFPT